MVFILAECVVVMTVIPIRAAAILNGLMSYILFLGDSTSSFLLLEILPITPKPVDPTKDNNPTAIETAAFPSGSVCATGELLQYS